MMKITKVTVAALIGLGLLSTPAMADAAKGQKLFQKKMKSVCGKSGAVFAASHSQMEWEVAKEEGKFTSMMIEACPAGSDLIKSDKFQKKFKTHLFDFVYEFANDSGNIPSC